MYMYILRIYLYIPIYVYIGIYMYIHIYIHIYIYVCMHMYVPIHVRKLHIFLLRINITSKPFCSFLPSKREITIVWKAFG